MKPSPQFACTSGASFIWKHILRVESHGRSRIFGALREDLARYRRRDVLLNPATWAIISYRFRRWVFKLRVPIALKWPLSAIALIGDLAVRIASKVELPTKAEIGPGLYIPHTGYVVLSRKVSIGRFCTLSHGVTIGHARGGSHDGGGCPVIGSRVYIGPRAAIIGPIEIGDDALIGVGAVVIRSVPAGGVVVGNPARLISRTGSFEIVSYRGMEKDPERENALRRLKAALNTGDACQQSEPDGREA